MNKNGSLCEPFFVALNSKVKVCDAYADDSSR